MSSYMSGTCRFCGQETDEYGKCKHLNEEDDKLLRSIMDMYDSMPMQDAELQHISVPTVQESTELYTTPSVASNKSDFREIPMSNYFEHCCIVNQPQNSHDLGVHNAYYNAVTGNFQREQNQEQYEHEEEEGDSADFEPLSPPKRAKRKPRVNRKLKQLKKSKKTTDTEYCDSEKRTAAKPKAKRAPRGKKAANAKKAQTQDDLDVTPSLVSKEFQRHEYINSFVDFYERRADTRPEMSRNEALLCAAIDYADDKDDGDVRTPRKKTKARRAKPAKARRTRTKSKTRGNVDENAYELRTPKSRKR